MSPEARSGEAIIAATAIESRAQLFTLGDDFRVLAKAGLDIL